MIINEEKEQFENNIQLSEYIASFWNHEAVKKIRESRERRKKHAFLSDDKFEESVRNKEFKNNPWLEKILKMRGSNANVRGYNVSSDNKALKSPTDLSYLASLTEDLE